MTRFIGQVGVSFADLEALPVPVKNTASSDIEAVFETIGPTDLRQLC
jgi:hypothetical protein